jgi:glycosyltransferase involved in cell wall biosynthesis
MLMSKLCRIPYFTITHGVDVWKLNRINLYGLKKSGKILTVSRFTRNKILAQLPDYAEKDIFIIPNTFDPEKFRPGPKPQHLMERMKLDKSDKVLFTVARLAKSEQHKGYDKVILAMSNVVKELPNVKFIIGGTGDDGGRIKQMIRQNGLETTVLLPGFIPDAELPDYYNLCDVFVMPSKKEGFGIVFLEALACGKPVVCGKQDGSVDPVLDGETGILVDPDNTQEIENAILKILRGEVDQHHLDGEYLRTRTLEEYGIDAFRTKVNRFMEEELDGNC